jgi:ATP-binding cassette subfamily B protein
MSASLAGTPMAVLDEQDVLDMVSEARTGLVDSIGPGAAVAALLAIVARYTQLLGAVGLIGFVLGPVPKGRLGLDYSSWRDGRHSREGL